MTAKGNSVDSVTVIMAAYNAMPYLRDAVDSICNQTLTGWRMLIVNDASTDDSAAYLNSIVDSRVEVMHLARNSGQGPARNAALARCNTPFVAIMDSDDVAHRDRLAAQVAFLQANPSVGVVGTQFTYLGGSGRTGFGSWLACEHDAIFDNFLHGRHAIVNPSACFRTESLQQFGGYSSARVGEDWDIYLKIGAVSRLANLRECYHYYRVHRASTTSTRLREVRLQYAYACHNARQRLANRPEVPFEQFEAGVNQQPFLDRLAARYEVAALGLYRNGVGNVLHGHAVAGYSRLAAAALCAPATTGRRIVRIARSYRNALSAKRGPGRPQQTSFELGR